MMLPKRPDRTVTFGTRTRERPCSTGRSDWEHQATHGSAVCVRIGVGG